MRVVSGIPESVLEFFEVLFSNRGSRTENVVKVLLLENFREL